jgi:hypothetical protein
LYNEAANILAMSIGWRVEKGIFRLCELGFSRPVSENSYLFQMFRSCIIIVSCSVGP